jgi:hypothetical protein
MMKFYAIIALILLLVNGIKAVDDNTNQRTLMESVTDSIDANPEDFWFRPRRRPNKAPANPSMGMGMGSKMNKPTPKMGMPMPKPMKKPTKKSMKKPAGGKGNFRA